MPGTRARIACAAAVAACAVALAACGGGDEGTIPRDQGETLLAQLDAIQQSTENLQCDAAQATADEFVATVNALPDEVDKDVRAKLLQAAQNLEELAADPTQCREPDTGTTDVETTTEETTTEPTTSTTSTTEETTTDEETTGEPSTGGEPPADTPGNGNPGGGSGEDFEGGGSSGGIGAG